MTDSSGNNKTLRVFYLVSATIASGFTLLIACSLVLIFRYERVEAIALARNEAAATFNKDQAFRFWATMHGGVYVPVTGETQPNPYLSHIPERDITTPSGRRLTLMNPAYMMKQSMMVYHDLYGIKGHITSLRPLNPVNAPDPWERKALEAFGRGEKEVTGVVELDGNPYFRFMRPMIAQEGCLKCHGFQGYRKGEIRGGVGVMVPMAPYLALEKTNNSLLLTSYLIVWGLGMSGIGFGFVRARRGILEQQNGEAEIRRLNADLEQRVNERTAQLAAANRELEAFSYSISHDLRAPLRGIDGFSRVLQEEYCDKLDDQGKNCLHRVRSATRRMGQLIDDLLKLSRVTGNEPDIVTVDLSSIAREVAEDLRNSHSERRISIRIAEGLTADCDPNLLRVVLENLFANAWKFTGEKGEGSIEFGVADMDGKCTYFVRDDGVGFDMAYSDKLFAPFQRLHGNDRFPGSGIGLSIVQRIIHRHGGKVWGEGEVGKGATFYFTLGSG